MRTDPAVISGAPTDFSDPDNPEVDFLYQYIGDLTDKLAGAEAEIEKLNASKSIDQVKARLLKPYANKVFYFVVAYCMVVALMLFLAGFKAHGFALPDTILGIISGSTAVSVIGLIGMVVTGLFRDGAK